MAYTVKKYGCDISEVNPDSSWRSWLNSSRFVIIRAGYTGSSTEQPATDSDFESNYAYARSKACPAGAYYWTRANTAAKARQEADYFYNLCSGKVLPYGLWVDMEDAVIQTSNYLTVANAFCARLRERGFTGIVGVYASEWRWWSGGGLENMTAYYRWVANYGSVDDGTLTMTTVPNCYMQQYTTYPAAGLHFDTNVLYGTAPDGSDDPLPPSPGGGTGKKNSSSGSSAKKKTKTLDEYVWDVVQGKYGNGAARKKKLGKMYDKVQNRLNDVWNKATLVIRGYYGNGRKREQLLGSDYDIVQKIVNHRLGVK